MIRNDKRRRNYAIGLVLALIACSGAWLWRSLIADDPLPNHTQLTMAQAQNLESNQSLPVIVDRATARVKRGAKKIIERGAQAVGLSDSREATPRALPPLPEPQSASIVLRTHNGEPLPHLLIELLPGGGDGPMTLSAMTDENGFAQFEGLRPKVEYWFSISGFHTSSPFSPKFVKGDDAPNLSVSLDLSDCVWGEIEAPQDALRPLQFTCHAESAMSGEGYANTSELFHNGRGFFISTPLSPGDVRLRAALVDANEKTWFAFVPAPRGARFERAKLIDIPCIKLRIDGSENQLSYDAAKLLIDGKVIAQGYSNRSVSVFYPIQPYGGPETNLESSTSALMRGLEAASCAAIARRSSLCEIVAYDRDGFERRAILETALLLGSPAVVDFPPPQLATVRVLNEALGVDSLNLYYEDDDRRASLNLSDGSGVLSPGRVWIWSNSGVLTKPVQIDCVADQVSEVLLEVLESAEIVLKADAIGNGKRVAVGIQYRGVGEWNPADSIHIHIQMMRDPQPIREKKADSSEGTQGTSPANITVSSYHDSASAQTTILVQAGRALTLTVSDETYIIRLSGWMDARELEKPEPYTLEIPALVPGESREVLIHALDK